MTIGPDHSSRIQSRSFQVMERSRLPAIQALPPIAQEVGSKVDLFLDSGVRSGLDVLKALALGAKACFVGRAWAYALGAGGRDAVAGMLGTLRAELEVAMILSGCRSVRDAHPGMVDQH